MIKKIGVVLAAILALALMLAVFVFTRPDIPPVDDSDLAFVRPNAPDAENGYPLLAEAIWKNYKPSDNKKFRDLLLSTKKYLTDTEYETVQKRYGGDIALLDKALAYPHIIAPSRAFEAGHIFDRTGHDWLAARDLARAIVVSARQDSHNGKKEEALRKLILAQKFGRRIQSCTPSLITFLIGQSIVSISMREMCEMIESDELPIDKVAASSQDIEEVSVESMRCTFKYEYAILKMLYSNESNEMIKNDKGFLIFRKIRLYKPNIQISNAFRNYRDYIKFTEPFRNESMDKYPLYCQRTLFESLISGNWYGYQEDSITCKVARTFGMKNTYIHVIDTSLFYDTLNVRSLRLKIALLAYRAKYGKLPEKLDALIPEIIDAIPIDPYDGKPLRYDVKKQIIYSVGINRIDEHGTSRFRMLKDYNKTEIIKSEKDYVMDVFPSRR